MRLTNYYKFIKLDLCSSTCLSAYSVQSVLLLQHDFTDDHTVLQLLECEFHSVDYHMMLDVVTGLKTAITLLEKVPLCISNMHDCVLTFVVS